MSPSLRAVDLVVSPGPPRHGSPRLVPRKRIDVSVRDLGAALRFCLLPFDERVLTSAVEQRFGAGHATLACLSVRTAFDLLLRALGLREGDEVVFSGFTIPHMPQIVREHGGVPVPLDLEVDTLEPRWALLPDLVGPRTRALVIAPLFGARVDPAPAAELARARGFVVVEDAAQAFAHDGWRGSPEAVATLFSFGTIKPSTALGGALAVVRDPGLADRMRGLRDEAPRKSRVSFARRVLRTALAMWILRPGVLGRLDALLRAVGRDPDAFLNEFTRSYRSGALLPALRQRPSWAQLALLRRRLEADYRPPRLDVATARRIARALPSGTRWLGGGADPPGTWLFAVAQPEREALVAHLRSHGFDATPGASILAPVRHPRVRAEAVEAFADEIVYLPVDALDPPDLERLIGALQSAPGARQQVPSGDNAR